MNAKQKKARKTATSYLIDRAANKRNWTRRTR